MFNFDILASLKKDKRGATAIEYGLIVGLVSIVAIGAMQNFATGSNGLWTTAAAKLAPKLGATP